MKIYILKLKKYVKALYRFILVILCLLFILVRLVEKKVSHQVGSLNRQTLEENHNYIRSPAEKINETFCTTWNQRLISSGRHAKTTRVVVFEPVPNAGFANQLRGIVSSLFVAALTERAFFINWNTDKFALEKFLLPNCLDWRITENSILKRSTEIDHLVISGSRKGKGHPRVSHLLQTRDMNKLYAKKILTISSNDLFFDNFFHSAHYCRKIRGKMHFEHPDAVFPVIFNFLFTPTAELQAVISKTMYEIDEPKIGIQMRLGGSESDKNFHDPASKKMAIRESNRRSFQKCVEHILGSNRFGILAQPSLFVTSDSSDFRNYFSNNRFKLVSNEGPVEHTSSSKVTHNGLMKVFADFIVLSKCEFVILSPGTFGWSAALAGRSKIYHVSDNNDGIPCKKVVCGHNSRYCSFSWSGLGVISSRNELRTHLEISQTWDPYLAEANSEAQDIIDSKILLKKKRNTCSWNLGKFS